MISFLACDKKTSINIMIFSSLRNIFSFLILFFSGFWVFGADADFPPKPNPPRLVNDFAGMMTPAQQDNLEAQLVEFSDKTSTQITVVTVKNLGGYDASQYATQLGNRWGVGKKGKENGVVILASSEDRKINISTGYGIEGALTDAMAGRIIRNEMAPEFKAGNYYLGFQKAANAIIAATKGEYTADKEADKKGVAPIGALLFIIIMIIVIMSLSGRSGGGGGGGGNYMSRRGDGFLTGAILGSLLGGAGRGGSWGGSSGGFGGSSGGFGGFGGGSFGGGGASGGW